MTGPAAPTTNSRCPRCGNRSAARYCPFCSKRCADLDLADWLDERHVIPGEETAAPEEGGNLEGEKA